MTFSNELTKQAEIQIYFAGDDVFEFRRFPAEIDNRRKSAEKPIPPISWKVNDRFFGVWRGDFGTSTKTAR
jgi:hypothetical protein